MRGKLPCHRDEGSCDDHASERPRAGYPGTQRATPTVTALEGYGVLVTGGGSGIGEGCALALARDGAVVTLCGRTADKLDARGRAASATRCPAPGSTRSSPTSPTRARSRLPSRRRRARRRAARRGALGRRVAAHGPAAPRRRRSGARDLRAQHDGHVPHAQALGARASRRPAARSWASRRTSRRETERFLGAYASSKAGLDQLVRIAADELGPARIRVNSIRPGIIDNELMTAITSGGPVLDSYLAEIPLSACRHGRRRGPARALPHRAGVDAG